MDASEFEFTQDYVETEFCKICRGCILVYDSIIASPCKLPNNENLIRDEFMRYLKNTQYRKKYLKLDKFFFDKELPEGSGRADIRVLAPNHLDDDNAYYIIECKRINSVNTTGVAGLNAEYVKNGICRFVTGLYSSYNGYCGMMGFVVDKMDIHQNTCGNINTLLYQDMINDKGENVSANPLMALTNIIIDNKFEFSYVSKHKQNDENGEITMYHLMFDLSDVVT